MVKSQSGQASVEFIVIAVVLVTMSIGIFKALRDNNVFPTMVSGPGDYLRGMVENGVWKPYQEGKALHPSHLGRKVAIKPSN